MSEILPEQSNGKDGLAVWTPRIAIGMALGIATLLGFALWADFDDLVKAFGSFSVWLLIPVLGLSTFNYLLRAIRWHLYLRRTGSNLPWGQSLAIFLAGLSMSVTPGKIGELIKVGLVSQSDGAPIARTFPVVITERLIDLVSVILLATIGVMVLGQSLDILVMGIAVTAGLFAVLATRPGIRLVFFVAAKFLKGRIPAKSVEESYGIQRDLLGIRPLLMGTGIGVLSWFAEAAGAWLVVIGFTGGDWSIGTATFAYAIGTLAGALSFLPGGLVATEATLAFLLSGHAFSSLPPAESESLAIAATLIIRAATLWFAVGLGFVALLVLGIKNRKPSDS